MRLKARILEIIECKPKGIFEEDLFTHFSTSRVNRGNFLNAIKRLIEQNKIEGILRLGGIIYRFKSFA